LDISDASPATTPSTLTPADAATPIETSKSPETALSTSIDAAEIASPSLLTASAAATLFAPLMSQVNAVYDDDAFSQNDADMTKHVDLFCEKVEAAALDQPKPALPVIIDISGDDDGDDDDDDGILAFQSLTGSSGQGNWLI
jgi:hypothetical protein